jgi:hypothetical protein
VDEDIVKEKEVTKVARDAWVTLTQAWKLPVEACWSIDLKINGPN